MPSPTSSSTARAHGIARRQHRFIDQLALISAAAAAAATGQVK